jgi:hypothetical protein
VLVSDSGLLADASKLMVLPLAVVKKPLFSSSCSLEEGSVATATLPLRRLEYATVWEFYKVKKSLFLRELFL